MSRADTTVLLRPTDAPGRDPWDDLLRLARLVEATTTRSLARRWMHWLAPLVLAGLIGAVALGGPGLWTDELATWGMATTPWHEFWPVLRYVDGVLAPYYVLMHAWVSVFGDSDIALRAPSLLAMAASAGLIGVIGARLGGRRTGLLAGVVFALLPSTSRFAAEARPYALTVLAACVATVLLMQAWQRPNLGWWAAYAAAIAVLGWLHVVALLLVVGHAWSVAAWKRAQWWRFLPAVAAGIAASAPILIYGVRQRHQVAYIPRIGLGTVLPYGQVVFGALLVAIVVVALALFSLPLRFPTAVFTAWAVAPAAALGVVSLALPMFLPRYLIYTTPGWALLAGACLARLRPQWRIATVAVLAVVAVPAQLQMRTPGGHEQATRQLAGVIAAASRPGDGVIYADDEPIGGWTMRDTIAHYLTPSQRPADVLATHPPRTAGLLLATECSDVVACVAGRPRLWVVRIGTLADPLAGIGVTKHDLLSREYTVDRVWYPRGLTIAVLERSPPAS
ncbi:MAG: glycosyltransferase family 39 protein [Micromonosporaceae bacterium]